MSNYVADALTAPEKPRLTPPMRRNLLVALGIAVIIETTSRVSSRLDLANELPLEILSIIAATLAGATIVLLVGYTCHRKSITVTMVVAATAIIMSSLLHATGNFYVFDGINILSEGTPHRSLVLSIADIIGISAWIFGFFGLVFELNLARDALGTQHGRLAAEMDERMRAEFSLKENEALFCAIFERSGAGILVLNSRGTVLRCNTVLADELGIPADTLEDMDIAALIAPQDRDRFSATLRALLRPDACAQRDSFRLATRDGDTIWFSMTLTPVAAASGECGKVVAIVDSTRFGQLHEKRILYQQKMESIGLLAGGIAHDFNNLFVGIMANAELLERDAAGHPESVAICRDIVVSTQRAAALCQQLLAYAGKVPTANEALDLSRLLLSSENLMRLSIARNAKLAIECEEDLPAIQGDPEQIRQVILQLLSNASDALNGADGQLRIRIGARSLGDGDLEGFLSEQAPPQAGDYVALTVSDTGAGIADGDTEKLFDPFYTTKRAGSGLGLAAVLGIVRAHHGIVQVQSKLGKGTEFRILFPSTGKRATPPARQEDAASDTLWPAAPGATVLLVDDEEMVIGAARRILERNGFTVITARNGQEGVDLFRQHHEQISIVLLDLTMPVMSGETACRIMQSISSQVPIVLCSGYSESETSDSDVGLRAAGYLRKPYRIKALLDTVNAVIARA